MNQGFRIWEEKSLEKGKIVTIPEPYTDAILFTHNRSYNYVPIMAGRRSAGNLNQILHGSAECRSRQDRHIPDNNRHFIVPMNRP